VGGSGKKSGEKETLRKGEKGLRRVKNGDEFRDSKNSSVAMIRHGKNITSPWELREKQGSDGSTAENRKKGLFEENLLKRGEFVRSQGLTEAEQRGWRRSFVGQGEGKSQIWGGGLHSVRMGVQT